MFQKYRLAVQTLVSVGFWIVETSGVEPPTSSLRTRRSPS